ncbi:tRNA (adenosine(37)-N6)-threonylcarbamoyltransferase complex transferase subunit TsaD [Candidatus Roizmanbacteria bacterium]|nr:tRNA (adenosine(37)-N6)-threonylcarbamoyltransferase complex transferase subunit TsaD [Candidatus Roizmanbacteria bacterium]
MVILSIDTSCDETACAITEGRKVLSNVIYSQVLIHKKWGGVVPSLAKRAHEERIDFVVEETLRKSKLGSHAFQLIDYIAVTQGPGLAMALEVGMRKAKELSLKYNKKIIPVNHLEGHIYSSFVQNGKGNPLRDFSFPYLALIISGSHTDIVLMKGHITYEILGEKIDDAAGEALDKAARMLGFGYPGGAVIERLAQEVKNIDEYHFPRPMLHSKNLQFSFSGLKTSLFYFLKIMPEKEKISKIKEIASSFQEAVFETIIKKTEDAIKQTCIKNIIVGGGVIANTYLRNKFRKLVKKHDGSILFPPYPYLTGDNAAMIGVAAYYKAEKGIFVEDNETLDRLPRFPLVNST